MASPSGSLRSVVDEKQDGGVQDANSKHSCVDSTSHRAKNSGPSPTVKPSRSTTQDDSPGHVMANEESVTLDEDESKEVPTSPVAVDDLESSQPPSPKAEAAAPVRQRWNSPRINIARLTTACLIQLSDGMNDSAPGALLPYIEEHYRINYTVVSMIFICNAAGFLAAAFWVHALDQKLGRARTMMINEGLCLLGYAVLSAAPPFPAFAIMYFVTGVGIATNLALNNVFTANLASSNKPLGTFHGFYGLGGLLAPIFATAMVSSGITFQRFYLIMLGLRVATLISSGVVFWRFEQDSPQLNKAVEETSSGEKAKRSAREDLKQSLRNRITPFGALFIFAYQGAEVSISGWVISFLISTRGGDPAHVGYVTAGFWGGITFSRFFLNPLGPRIGERWFAYVLIIGTVAFQFVVWFAPNVIADAVATAMLGVLLGPIYPCATSVFTKLLPGKIQNSSLAFIGSAGSTGGALAPFLTGIIAQSKGTYVLHPICVALYVVMIACWVVLTKGYERRRRV